MQKLLNNIAINLHADENELANQIINNAKTTKVNNELIQKQASQWVQAIRNNQQLNQDLTNFFNNMDLSSEEGVSLMCMAEAMLRIPDNTTTNKFLTEYLTNNAGIATSQRQGWFANVAHWGLVLGAQIIKPSNDSWYNCLQKTVNKLGTPLVRTTVTKIMSILGNHFIMGETIQQAIKKQDPSYNQSYDMLGESAVTMTDANKYFQAYTAAITAIATQAKSNNTFENSGISIKLSALHPRYEWAKHKVCKQFLVNQLVELGTQAKLANINLTVDAEEISRLSLSLEIFTLAWQHPAINYWHGFGLAVQAYHKAAIDVIKYLIELAKTNNSKIPVRLVKGAYWDSEIKHAQVHGISIPVWTRKAMTDVNYLACAQLMLTATEQIYCQFATHNAHTVAYIIQLAQNNDYEFQCLHGMGKVLYSQIVPTNKIKCRIYAPVGAHKTLLPYLVRRLLENGANSSFVHQLVNAKTSIANLIQCPIAKITTYPTIKNLDIKEFTNIFPHRNNSAGLNLDHAYYTQQLIHDLANISTNYQVNCDPTLTPIDIYGPIIRNKPIGQLALVTKEQVSAAVNIAVNFLPSWQQTSLEHRANILTTAADILAQTTTEMIYLCIYEAGKTWQDAIDEIREAIDFLRYYAQQAPIVLAEKACPGPNGEQNLWRTQGRGTILCLSPWNFPLAIFVGQISAALVAGNTVLAKPASQTTIIAQKMLEILYQAGLPQAACQLLPGSSKIAGTPLVKSDKIKGVMLTGSTSTAKAIALDLANRNGPIVPLIAETGGQNAMIVDSTALLEQVTNDVIASAFKSAGQRCSACRVLFIQAEIFKPLVELIVGAMQTLTIGDPLELNTDVGPVIDANAKQELNKHVEYLQSQSAKLLYGCKLPDDLPNGHFFAPRLYTIDSLDQLDKEVFGPILHIIKFNSDQLDQVVESIHKTNYGLTVGIQSRMPTFCNELARKLDVGNVYINRNMIGAVVESQPFGGNNLSGTGPKAGGPWYLTRLVKEQTVSINTSAIGGDLDLLQTTG